MHYWAQNIAKIEQGASEKVSEIPDQRSAQEWETYKRLEQRDRKGGVHLVMCLLRNKMAKKVVPVIINITEIREISLSCLIFKIATCINLIL